MTPEDLKLVVDTVWVLLSGALVFFMNAGFALVESGLCRSKNAVNVLSKNFIVFALAVVGFWSIGYALAFGDGGLVGTSGFFLAGLPATREGGLPTAAFFFFQLVFAGTAATIVSGAVAERIKIQSFMVFAVVLTAVIYPVITHWVWGGGWLARRGFADFAGSTVVHSVGGWAALVGAALLGPRLGKYSRDGKVNPIPGHNMTSVTLGGLILWFGWFGFNGGSQLAADGPAIAHILVTTTLGGALGGTAATLWAWVRVRKPDLTLMVNGVLAGLVGITAGCAFVDPFGAAAIGAIAGLAAVEAVMLFDRVRIDDPVGATSVHLVGGVLGTLLVGVFGKASLGLQHDGLAYGGGLAQLAVQATGVGVTALFVAATSLVAWVAIRKVVGLRVTEEEEIAGLDVTEMGLEAYPPDRGTDSREIVPGPAVGAAAPLLEPSLQNDR